MASPSPSWGIGATAMAVGLARSAARSMAKRLAAASLRSPRGLRLNGDAESAHQLEGLDLAAGLLLGLR